MVGMRWEARHVQVEEDTCWMMREVDMLSAEIFCGRYFAQRMDGRKKRFYRIW